MALESQPQSAFIHEDGDGLQGGDRHQQQDESKPDVAEGQSKNDGEMERSKDDEEYQPEMIESDIDSTRDISEKEPTSVPMEDAAVVLDQRDPEQSQSTGERSAAPEIQNKRESISDDGDAESASVAATDGSSAGKSDRVLDSDLELRTNALDGIEEVVSPRPADEEQPFVSEQFEDETQTIVGEGSLLGDSDEGSALRSPRSDDVIIESVLEIAACADDVVVADFTQAELGPNHVDVVGELIVAAEAVVMESDGGEPSDMDVEAETCAEQDVVEDSPIIVADPSSAPQPENVDDTPVSAETAIIGSSTMEPPTSSDIAMGNDSPQAAAASADEKADGDNEAESDSEEVVGQESALVVVKKKSSWFPKQWFNSCTLI